MVEIIRKFYLLMWKNLIITVRHRCQTIFEIIFPLIMIFLLVVSRKFLIVESDYDSSFFQDYRYDEKDKNYASMMGQICRRYSYNSINENNEQEIAYCPKTGEMLALVFYFCPREGEDGITFDQYVRYFKGFENESDFEKKIKSDKKYLDSVGFALLLNKSPIRNVVNETPIDYKVTIRFSRNQLYTDRVYPPVEDLKHHSFNNYAFQLVLIKTFRHIFGKYDETKLLFRPFQTNQYINDKFLNKEMENIVIFQFALVFLYNYLIAIKLVVTEKENQCRESLKIMGLPVWLQWFCLFLTRLIINIIVIIIAVCIWKTNFSQKAVFAVSAGSQIFLFLFLYTCSLTFSAFLISSFFTKATYAIFFGLVLYFVSLIPFFIIIGDPSKDGPSSSIVFLTSLLPNCGLGFGLVRIFIFERLNTGLQANNIWMVPRTQQFSVGNILMVFLVAFIIFVLLVLYLDEINPGAYGSRQPLYYVCLPSYWFGSKKVDDSIEERKTNENFEQISSNLPVGVQLKNLSKNFNKIQAVQNVNLDLYQGHITVLVGHNGAGKTTIMNLITGMFPPSRGRAIVNGFDVRQNLKQARENMGICFQDNILFDELTVKEHLLFFGTLKGANRKELNDEIEMYLKILELKKNQYPKALSGGMKRKLCTAIALCGKSKIVILDEPSSGLDPGSRRTLWSLLQKEKKDRTILLSTHFMDEADILGDRVAIIANGEIQCCGSSFFLKQKYGNVYYLILDVTPRCQPDKVTNLLRKYISSVEMQSYYGSEIRYRLGSNESSKFEVMLRDLESNQSSLDIRSFGITLASLDEVFMKVGVETKSSKISSRGKSKNRESSITYVTGWSLILNHLIALFLKQSLKIWRNWFFILLQLLLPLIPLIIFKSYSIEKSKSLPPLKMSLDSYNDPVVLLSGETTQAYQRFKNITQKYNVVETKDIAAEVDKQLSISVEDFKYHCICGATFSDTTVIAWFNGDLMHSETLITSLVMTSLTNYSTFTVINYPLPMRTNTQSTFIRMMGRELLLILLAMVLSIISGFFITGHVKERSSSSKHLQFLSGVNVALFWFVAFVVDYIIYVLIMCVILIVVASVNLDGFNSEQFDPLVLMFLIFFLAILSFTYLSSLMFRSPTAGYVFMIVLGFLTIPVIYILTDQEQGEEIYSFLLILPIYSGISGMVNIAALKEWVQLCPSDFITRCSKELSYYANNVNGIGLNLLISFIAFLCYLGLLLLIEIGACRQFCVRKKRPIVVDNLDDDVKEENNRIQNLSDQDIKKSYTLVLKSLTKFFKKKPVVNGLSFGVKAGECFGLLGENGAGKTTTFKMLTQDISISYGDAFIDGCSVRKHKIWISKSVGYCPQFDGLSDDLTVRETLRIYALIHGVPWKSCDDIIEEYAEDFELTQHLSQLVGHLSGGTKRKLSSILALMGDTPLVFFDEPSSGMDPASKRLLWSLLRKCRESGKCIILTSQSMEECEALCTRVSIMIKGNLQCLGSTQRLKNKFAQGYRLIIKMKKPADENKFKNIDGFIKRSFPGAVLDESFQEMLSYNLTKTSMSWSSMFGVLENNKKGLNIEDYSLGQCSLEQVFLSFVKHD